MLDDGMRAVFAARLKARTVSVLMAGECHRVVYMNWSGSEKMSKSYFKLGFKVH